MTSAKIRLRTFTVLGDPTQIIKSISFGGGPNTSRRRISISRSDFCEFVEKVAEDEGLVKCIIFYWESKIADMLKGAVNSGFEHRPYQEQYHNIALKIGGEKALTIGSIMSREVDIFVLHRNINLLDHAKRKSIVFDFFEKAD